MTRSTFFDALRYDEMVRAYPVGNDFVETFSKLSRDELRGQQETRFAAVMKRAWQVPFYQKLWGAQGIEAGDINVLDDLTKLPTYDKADLMASIEREPPFGDYHGIDRTDPDRPPVIFQTTSGTTGNPQVIFWGPRSREMQNLLLSRIYHLQGLRADDVVHSVYGHGMINGGHYVRETFHHWLNAIFLSAGTGAETRSVQQVHIMKQFGVTVIAGFIDYIKKLADVAREEGLVPGQDIPIRMISGHFGRENREAISAAWGGAQCFDWYGVADTGMVAGEGAEAQGMYVMEDAQYLELLDIETNLPVGNGETGNMVCTCLFKDDVYPIIRFNTHDVSAFRTDPAPSELVFKRIDGFLGRSDNMVKIRGINVFPQGIGPMLEEHDGFAGEFICRCERNATGRDELIVCAEVNGPTDQYETLATDFKALIKRKLGIDVQVEVSAPGSLADLTQIEKRQKPIRLIDKRFK